MVGERILADEHSGIVIDDNLQPDTGQVAQQMLRYGSGLHLTIDRQSVLADQVGYGLIKLTDNSIWGQLPPASPQPILGM